LSISCLQKNNNSFYFCISTLWIGTLVHGSGNVAFRPRQWGPYYQKW